jgi:ATP-binding cassette subfamily B multidrug efflux pump
MHYIRTIFSYLKPYWIAATLAPLVMILVVTMDLTQPKLMQNVVDIGIAHHNLGYVTHYGLLMIALALVSLLGGLGGAYFSTIAAQNVGYDLRNDLFTRVQSLSFGNLDKLDTGHLVTVLTNDVQQVQLVVMMSLRVLVRVPLMIIGSLILAVLISPKLSLILFVLIPVILTVLFWLINKSFPIYKLVQSRLDNLNNIVQENLSGIRLVKAFVRSDYENEKFQSVNDDLTDTTIRALKINTTIGPCMMVIMNLGLVAVIWLGGQQAIAGSLQVGKIMAFLNYLLQILTSLMTVTFIFMNLSRAQASAVRIAGVLDEKPEIRDKNIVTLNEIKGEVIFDHVTFSYNGKADPVLRDISFTAHPGETVAILGATGSGKTSLVHLIPRLYDLQAGRILIDGLDVRDYPNEMLRRSTALVFQQAMIFSGSVKDNIRYGRPQATDQEVVQAAHIAQADDFISALPAGYDTILEQRGVNLSGGQKQRLAIARAVLLRPRILILDDSTSAVDLKTESRIQEALQKVIKDTTCFIIAQRITSVMNADQIIVLNDGVVDAVGTHAELMQRSEIYRDIYRSQLGEDGQRYG